MIVKLINVSAGTKTACGVIDDQFESTRVKIITKYFGQRMAIRNRQKRDDLPDEAADMLVEVIRSAQSAEITAAKTVAFQEIMHLVRKGERKSRWK